MTTQAFHACARFGLGPYNGEIAAVGRDPVSYLLAQLKAPRIPPEVAGFTGNSEATQALVNHFLKNKADKVEKTMKTIKQEYLRETSARFTAHVNSRQPFIERLVMFWSNHFAVSVQKPVVAALVNKFEVEAIRPHVTGKFKDMLRAVEQHPAMLMYLDNAQSFGPNSKVGQRRTKGLNENLAREILELHTLGVSGGYTQADVTNLAKIITGWSMTRKGEDVIPQFRFHSLAHEPGAHELLGKTYSGDDLAEGERALDDLAAHPATARHIATKMARHFIADNPPASAVSRLETVFRRTDGDLGQMARELVTLRESWEQPLAKFKTPYEFLVSSFRLLGIEPQQKQVIGGLEMLNYRVFGPSSPAGYGDMAEDWASADAITKRLEWSRAAANKVFTRDTNPAALADAAYGPVMREETRFIIAGAESGRDALAFVLVSPEFQRR